MIGKVLTEKLSRYKVFRPPSDGGLMILPETFRDVIVEAITYLFMLLLFLFLFFNYELSQQRLSQQRLASQAEPSQAKPSRANRLTQVNIG